MGKLLFFASDYKIGLSALLTDQLLALHESGIDVCALAGENEQEPGLTERIRQKDVPLQRIQGLDAHRDFKKLVTLIAHKILNAQIDVVHVQNNWQLLLVAFVKYKLFFKRHFRIIYTLHGFRHNSRWKSYIAQLLIGTALFLFADKVICMCSFLKNKFRWLSYKIVLLPLGIPDYFFQDCQPALPADGLQMIFPAQFRKGKNQDMIIKAFANYIALTGDKKSKLVLPGNGDLLGEMKQLAKELKLSARVDFPGLCTKDEIYQLYLKSNIGIISSNSETFGQSIVEPFVLGRCVLSTPVGIAKDIIHSGENGYLFTSEHGLTEVLVKLHQSPNLISEMGKKNYLQRNQFRWKDICNSYKRYFIQ